MKRQTSITKSTLVRLHVLRSYVFTVGMVVLLVSFLGACQRQRPPDPRADTNMVSVEGSDTMAGILSACTEAFHKENPNVPVSVTAADSGRGIKALLARTTDIAASSRDLNPEESKLAHKSDIHLERTAVARDCIAVIANERCPIDDISLIELKKAFTTEKVKWSDLGGRSSTAVKVYVREPDSGTSLYFLQHIMGKDGSKKGDGTSVEYAKSAEVVTSSDAVLEGVSTNVDGIGYVGLGKVHKTKLKIKVLKLKLAETSPGVLPSADALSSNYILSRPLYMFFDANAKPTTRQFVDFCLSPAGQKIVKEQGFVSIK